MPINLLMPNGELRELSRESEIVEAIAGKKRTDHKLYYPQDFVDNLPEGAVKKRIKEILQG